MFRKLFFILVLGYTFTPFFIANAAIDNTSKLPEFNPFCWHRSDCYKIRETFLSGSPSNAELEQGFITDASVAPCVGGTGDNQWGRCLPAGQTKTEISFGGQDKFSNIGEFILLMYKYLLTIASIVAVVVVIIAGAQWITSGGNSEAIGSAKKRIAGAFIGLFIAYMSYFVLNTINPALVNLRLPQVWLIKPVELMPAFCQDIEGADTKKFMLVGTTHTITQIEQNSSEENPDRTGGGVNEVDGEESAVKVLRVGIDKLQSEPVSLEQELASGNKYTYTKPKGNSVFKCGERFFVEGGGTSITCRGKWCQDAKNPCQGNSCDPSAEERYKPGASPTYASCFDSDGKRAYYSCYEADRQQMRISGRIQYSSGGGLACGFTALPGVGGFASLATEWRCPPVITVWLLTVCTQPPPTGEPSDAINDKLRLGTGGIIEDNKYYYGVRSSAGGVVEAATKFCERNDWGEVKGFVLNAKMQRTTVSRNISIGKGGVDLGANGAGIVKELWRVDPKYLFTAEELLDGAVMDIDAANFEYNESITDKNKSYWEPQYR